MKIVLQFLGKPLSSSGSWGITKRRRLHASCYVQECVMALGPAGSLLSNSFLKLASDACKQPAGNAPESALTSDFVHRNHLGIAAFIEQKSATDNLTE